MYFLISKTAAMADIADTLSLGYSKNICSTNASSEIKKNFISVSFLKEGHYLGFHNKGGYDPNYKNLDLCLYTEQPDGSFSRKKLTPRIFIDSAKIKKENTTDRETILKNFKAFNDFFNKRQYGRFFSDYEEPEEILDAYWGQKPVAEKYLNYSPYNPQHPYASKTTDTGNILRHRGVTFRNNFGVLMEYCITFFEDENRVVLTEGQNYIYNNG